MDSGMISVDKWGSGSQAYFLTHLHADHTAGLSSAWRRGLLYCSRLTAKLLPCKFPGFDLSLLRVIDIGPWYSLSLTSPTSGSASDVYVKAIDAQHCPGSVMYLFRGKFGCKLYTGDFRWEKTGIRVENAKSMLLDALKNETLDVLYLDNTYCNPIYTFPSREIAAQQIVDIITSHPSHDVVIGIDSLGKEDLLLHIARTLDIKIWVWPERLQIMHLLGFHKNFTTQTSLTRVRAVPRYSFSTETLENLNAVRPTIGIMPSGLPWATKQGTNTFGPSSKAKKDCSKDISTLSNTPTSRNGQTTNGHIFIVPYSDHSCFPEIQEFVELLRPVNIRGIMSSGPYCVDPCYYFDHLCGTKQAFWRIQRQLENEDVMERADNACEKDIAKGTTSSVVGRKRKFDLVDFSGVRVSRVSLLSRGGKIVDTKYLS